MEFPQSSILAEVALTFSTSVYAMMHHRQWASTAGTGSFSIHKLSLLITLVRSSSHHSYMFTYPEGCFSSVSSHGLVREVGMRLLRTLRFFTCAGALSKAACPSKQSVQGRSHAELAG
ncbi:hypothetical protein L226DRAFT_538273 [Lentinus tigrinus ALCF2SS1-7]|uniref:uncharacterized protein n=1 Tax=Lentinus tigrinus ALCF2SS1-7 TaxID=1328758 RepID=UPI001166264C|nr:hypothetical protein L226DRAFT_538273 [Lentinus tigrinus ALCF2SS1-7]